MGNGGVCVLKDDMQHILELFQKADILVLATPVYFYGVSAQMDVLNNAVGDQIPHGSTASHSFTAVGRGYCHGGHLDEGDAVMLSLFHNKANTRPMGRVKYMSMVSSVSLDFNDSRKQGLEVVIHFPV